MDGKTKNQIPNSKFQKKQICHWSFEIGYSPVKIGAGFTLIELLVVVFIMALIFGIGFASYREFSHRQSLLGISRQIKGDLRTAQSQALAGQKPMGCDVLSGYQFNWQSATSYSIEAVCLNGIYNTKTVNDIFVNTTMSAPSTDPILFQIIGAGTNLPSGSSTTIDLNQATTANSQTITITSSGEIF